MPEILLNGPVGRLEARYTHNNNSNSPSILILHAHPGHGGNMNNNLSLMLHKFFSDNGFSSLRFNFRGVGKSDGEHDGSEESLLIQRLHLIGFKIRIQSLKNIGYVGFHLELGLACNF